MTIRNLMKILPLSFDNRNSGLIKDTKIYFTIVFNSNDKDLNDLDRDIKVILYRDYNNSYSKHGDDLVCDYLLDKFPELQKYSRNRKIDEFLKL